MYTASIHVCIQLHNKAIQLIIVISHLAPIVTFTQSTYNVDEDDGPVQPVLILSNPSSTDITISVFSTDGSATGKDTLLPTIEDSCL